MRDIEMDRRPERGPGYLLICCAIAAVAGCGGTELLDRLDGAEVVSSAPVERTTVRIDGDERPVLQVGSDVEVSFRGIAVKPGAVLDFGVAVDPDRWADAKDGVLFRVYGKTGTTRRLLYSQYVDPGQRAADRRWFDARVPLGPLVPAGSEAVDATIVLATLSGVRGAAMPEGALWARPRIVHPWRQPHATSRTPPNVVLISFDTLRADHLSLYGYQRPTSPRLDAWAADAVTFLQAQAPANATLDSHMSVMTSLHPDVHAVRALKHPPGRKNGLDALDGRRVTLAESLRAAGYVTAAFVHECYWMNPDFGFAQGFDTYRTLRHDAAHVNHAAVFPWLRQHREEPFFLFVHYFDIHSDWTKLPYDSPAQYRAQFAAPYAGSFTGCGDGLCASRYLLRLNREGRQLPSEDTEYIGRLYDAGIAYADQQIGMLFDQLRELGLWDRTMIIVMADHGEEFQEHGSFLHEQLYQETVGVPLIIGYPELIPEGRRVKTPVQTLDIMPTVLDALGLPLADDVQGESLMPILRGADTPGASGEPAAASRPGPLYSTNGNGRSYAVRVGDWKLIVKPRSGAQKLYDLGRDPDEQRDVSAHYPEHAARLRATLDTWISENQRRNKEFEAARDGSAQRLTPTEADMERLRNLGYVE